VTSDYRIVYGPEARATQSCIDDLITYYVDVSSCGNAETLLKSTQVGDDNRPPAAKQRQEERERRHRELIERVRPAAEKYQQTLAATKAEHPDTFAARQAFAVALRDQQRTSAAAYHLKAVLDARQRLMGADHFDTQTCRVELGTTRLQQRKYAEAETLFRDLLSVRQKQSPADWMMFQAQSLLGAALVGQKKYSDAEPLLLAGYAGMKQRESDIPMESKRRLVEALGRLVQLYDGWDKNDKADEWRKKLDDQKTQ
jgi:hypothetical protein